MSERERTLVVERPEQLWRVDTRRGFLKMLGLGGTIVLLPSIFAACDSDDTTGPGTNNAVTLNLSNDFGILNYAFALEQLEAAFYTAVLGSAAFAGMSAEQQEVFTDLRNHEVIHREFFRAALGSNKIGDLALNQSAVNTTIASVSSILQNAEAFEDLGVAAYNGAGKYLTNADYLTIAGKIVSVEARHAAAIRDLREAAGTAGTPAGARFAGDDVVQTSGGTYQGLDVKLEPGVVLTRVAATTVVSTTITTSGLPTKTGTPDAFPA